MVTSSHPTIIPPMFQVFTLFLALQHLQQTTPPCHLKRAGLQSASTQPLAQRALQVHHKQLQQLCPQPNAAVTSASTATQLTAHTVFRIFSTEAQSTSQPTPDVE